MGLGVGALMVQEALQLLPASFIKVTVSSKMSRGYFRHFTTVLSGTLKK
jgi:hypothetical protein